MRCGKGVFESVRQASGLAPGASEPEELPFRVLVEVVYGSGLGLGGIEFGRLVEVVGEGFLGDLVVLPTAGSHGELGLRRPPDGMKERGRSGLSDMGQDLGDGLRVGRPWGLLGEKELDRGAEGRGHCPSGPGP